MKLALVLTTWDGSAQPLFWQRILEELDDLGITSDVIATRVRPLVTTRQPPAGRRGYVPSVSYVRALLSSPAPVFLCVEYGVATALCVAAARMRGRHTIIFQEHSGREGLPLRGLERRYRRTLAWLSTAVIANTDAAFTEVTSVLGIDSRKTFRATLLVPPDRANLTSADIAPTPLTRRPVFLFVGNLVRRKNVNSLVEAAAELRLTGLDFELWIVGDGPERHLLETQAARLVREGVVRFLGRRAQETLGILYEAADVFVMPSLRDYRSVAVLEALRFGTPVIDSSRDGNAGDLVQHEITGLVFDPGRPGDLAAVMHRVVTEPALVKRLAGNAMTLMNNFTPHSSALELRNIIHAVQTRPM